MNFVSDKIATTLAAVVFPIGLLTACGTNCGGSTAPNGASTASFFRHSDEQAVYRISGDSYCLVADGAQMQAFGGFSRVKVVAPTVDFKKGKTAATGMVCETTK